MNLLLTHSRMKAFRSCPRKHYYAYGLGRRPIRESNALTQGTAVHRALETYWDARMDNVPPEARAQLAMDAIGDVGSEFDSARLSAMVEAYCVAWDTRAVAKVLAVELPFKTPLSGPGGRVHGLWKLAGKIDAVVRLQDGRIAIVEHKTTSSDSSAGSTYRDRLAMDSQVSAYFAGAASEGFEADVCLYDVLVKPAIKPLQATPAESRRYTKDGRLYATQRLEDETPTEFRARIVEAILAAPERYLQVFEVHRPEGELADAQRDAWAIAQEILVGEGSYPRRNPDACHEYGGCPYLSVCRREARIDDNEMFYTAGPHPELASSKEESR